MEAECSQTLVICQNTRRHVKQEVIFIHYHVHYSPPMDPMWSHMNIIHIHSSVFNIILPSTTTSSKVSFYLSDACPKLHLSSLPNVLRVLTITKNH